MRHLRTGSGRCAAALSLAMAVATLSGCEKENTPVSPAQNPVDESSAHAAAPAPAPTPEGTDLWRWIPGSESTGRFTATDEESEFSPTPIPDSDGGVSYIRSRTNTSGRLWRMPRQGADAAIIFPDIGPVGYHAWFDADHLASWLLQEPSLLQLMKISTGEAQPIARG
ncbi:hypothetical protein [Congregibacter sp.]|uniref:hypothetical protein n=1 Tax=Congregibacter sp. TaxID=2744308 RepID=UPI003F6D3389